MKIDSDELLQPGAPEASMAPRAGAWRTTLPLLAALIVAILGLYWGTAESIVAIWERSETFAHGYLIVPIALFLVWMRRDAVRALVPKPDPLGFALLAGAGFAWIVAAAGNVQVVQQFALVLMIPAAVVALAGRHVARALLFPLAFLLFGVPIGEALIPPLMDWTADFTVAALRLSGIPVYREGTFFTIPTGNWSVVEGCSGLRYLIASITVGALFAYLNYRKTAKRVMFVAASIIVPIIANGFRAYMIVMIAHLSDMKLALGVDHLIYGWVFFGIVMLLLFWIGSYWRDDTERGRDARAGSTASRYVPPSPARVAGATIAALGLAAAWPLYAAHLNEAIDGNAPIRLVAPSAEKGWSIGAEAMTDWRPRYEGESATVVQTYRNGERVVMLYLGYYRQQRRGAELVTSTNLMVVQKHPVWSNVGESARQELFGGEPIDLRQTLLRSPQQRLLVWDWFHIAGSDLTSRYVAKALLARDKLLGRGDDATAIIVATPYESTPDGAADTLRAFLRDMAPSIRAALADVDARSQLSRAGDAPGPR